MGKATAVDVQELVVGAKLESPIYDTNGVLLLNAGAVITRDVMIKMIRRGAHRVVVNESELSTVTDRPVSQEAVTDQAIAQLEKKLDERLENLLQSGMMAVENSGPAVRDSVVQHGAAPYDPEQHAAVYRQQLEHAAAAEDVIDEAVNGDDLHAPTMDEIADACIEQLVTDVQSTLSATFDLHTSSVISQHAVQVSTLAMAVGIELGLDAENVKLVGMSAMLADIGMLKVPSSVYEAGRELHRLELMDVQKHPIHTANLLEKHRHRVPTQLHMIAYQAHERCDGSGYPRGRKKKSIHPLARIVYVADAYVAMTSPRPHRPALMPYAAMRALLAETMEGKAAVEVVRGLLRVLSLYPVGSYVKLSDGSVAQVLRPNGEDFGQPIVQVCRTADGSPLADEPAENVIDLRESELSVSRALPSPDRTELDVDPRIEIREEYFREFLDSRSTSFVHKPQSHAPPDKSPAMASDGSET